MDVTFLGHAAFRIRGAGKEILIDPFISGNPQATVTLDELHPDIIVVTHGHGDHLGDGIKLAKRQGALFIAPYELVVYAQGKGVENAHPLHIGGGYNFDFGRVELTLALHGSVIQEGDKMLPGGNPVGVVLSLEGKNIYHAGDTGLFGDMRLIGEKRPLNLAMLPIGDNFTMGIDDAVRAVEMLKPETVIPMHYNTWDIISADPDDFARRVPQGTKAVVLKPGESFSL